MKRRKKTSRSSGSRSKRRFAFLAIILLVSGSGVFFFQDAIVHRGGVEGAEAQTNPPTFGPHEEAFPVSRILDRPLEKGVQVHILEHGGGLNQDKPGVLIQYSCRNCTQLVSKLRKLVETDLTRRTYLAPYYDMDALIALTAWKKLVTLDEYDEERIRRFLDETGGKYVSVVRSPTGEVRSMTDVPNGGANPIDYVLSIADMPSNFSMAGFERMGPENSPNGGGYHIEFVNGKKTKYIHSTASVFASEGGAAGALRLLKEKIKADSGLEVVSPLEIGEEALLYRLVDGGGMETYHVAFRKGRVLILITINNEEDTDTASEVVRYARLAEEKIP
jgi:hypothetical protein